MDDGLRYAGFYAPRNLKIVKGEGQYVWDKAGNRYLDCHAAHGSCLLGHKNKWVIEEIRAQLEKITVLSPIFDTDVKEEAVKALEKIAPKHFSYSYLLNGGGEAVELALKAVRRATGRKKFISFTGAFHGRTMGALSVTWNPTYRQNYDPFPWEVEFLPFNSVEAVERAVNESVAAVILEPVQGEGGLSVASEESLKAVRDACDKVGALMIVDEIQSGFGRTGVLWAHERANVEPDLMAIGKSIGGGFPVSATLFTEEVWSKLGPGAHGSTFGGNPLALAALKGGVRAFFEDSVLDKVNAAGGYLRRALEEVVAECPKIARGVKGLGLMIGLDLRREPTEVIKLLQSRGILALRAGLTALRLLPPYLIEKSDIDFLREKLIEALGEVAGKGR